MSFDSNFICGKLRHWESYLQNYRLPQWNEIPNVGLYMEQVLTVLREYLDYLPPELKDRQFLTAATINNYVQKKFMPEPIKKKYYRVHIAYLIMILTLKQSLSIATLQRLIPMGISEDEVSERYTAYADRHKKTADYFIEQVSLIAGPMLYDEEPRHDIAVNEAGDLIAVSAVISALSGLLAEKLLKLDEQSDDELCAAPEE